MTDTITPLQSMFKFSNVKAFICMKSMLWMVEGLLYSLELFWNSGGNWTGKEKHHPSPSERKHKVKPVYKDHPWESVEVDFIDRWPLYTGSNNMNKEHLGKPL